MAYNNLTGSEVRINRGGPDSVQGFLLGVQHDYLVLQTNDGVIYINGTHVKSISQTDGNKSRSMVTPQYVNAYSFGNLLQKLRHQVVQINGGGPEKVEGFIVEATQDYLILLVNGKEIVRIPVFHIKSVRIGSNNSSGGNKNSDNQNKSNNQNKSGNQNKSNNQNKSKKQNNNKTSGNKNKSNTSGKKR
jgi:spore coat protein B